MQHVKEFKLLALATASFWLVSCSSTPPTNLNLTEAESVVQRANADAQVTRYSPDMLQEANNNLKEAQTTWRIEGEDERETVDHLSYLAKQQALTAIERAAAEATKASIKTAGERRNELVLQSREREIRQLERRAQELQTLVEDLEAKQTERGLVLTIGDILFDFDKAELKPGGRKAVEYLATWLKENPNRNILIEAHTDARGSDEYNQALSRERAGAVQRALNDFGVPAGRIQTTGYGETYPVASNDSSVGRQQNRRVEIIIADAGGNAAIQGRN